MQPSDGARAACGAAALAACLTPAMIVGGVDCVVLPPSENTWTCEATVPPDDEVGVPPTPIAMYSCR